MTRDEVVDLLSLAAARDRRTVGKADVMAWHQDIGDLPFADAREAIGIHFRESTDWLMPAHVRRIVARLRDERGGVPGPGLSPAIPDADPDDVPAYLAAVREQRTRAADGHEVPALDAGESAGDPYDTPAARSIVALFKAQQAAARRRKSAEQQAEREALRIYRDAVEELLALDDHGAGAMAQAREELLGGAQAAQGFPRLAGHVGVTDEHRVTIRAAHIAAPEQACAPPAE